MTLSTVFSDDWASHTFGKALRALIGIGGVVTATLIVMFAALSQGAATWFLVAVGLVIAATAVRAAIVPSVLRLTTVLAALLAFPIAGLFI